MAAPQVSANSSTLSTAKPMCEKARMSSGRGMAGSSDGGPGVAPYGSGAGQAGARRDGGASRARPALAGGGRSVSSLQRSAREEVVTLATDAPPIRCSANVAFLFPDRPLVAALEAAAEAGFHTVELLDPYVMPLSELGAALERLGLHVDLMNLPFGDFARGDRGFSPPPPPPP